MLLELESLCERCRDCLAGLADEAKAARVECETVLESGVAAASILQAIPERQADLVVMGTRPLHGFERLIFGSTAEQVLRRSSKPVLTVGPRAAQSEKDGLVPGPVIFATDFNFTTMRAIRYAANFARLLGAPLHCLHVLPRALEAGQQREIVPGIMAGALAQLAAESGVAVDPPKCATTFGSEVSYSIVDYAREQRARLIVLGVRQASLLASHVPEHITYRIITEAGCPVLTMAYGVHASDECPCEAEKPHGKFAM
jgi:nucleotide-binding universal stress UspA family protein